MTQATEKPEPEISPSVQPEEASPQTDATSFHRILGIDFFDGSARAAIALMRDGGLLVVPAAPALKDLEHNHAYREALLGADLAITDSAFMVLLWNRLQSNPIKRLSGLEYLRELLLEPSLRQPGNTLWIMASPESASRNQAWLRQQGITLPEANIYVAPMYGKPHNNSNGSSTNGGQSEYLASATSDTVYAPSDPTFLALIDRLPPQHIVV